MPFPLPFPSAWEEPLPLPPLNPAGGCQDTHERSDPPCYNANTTGDAGVEDNSAACDLTPYNSNTQCQEGGLARTPLSLGMKCSCPFHLSLFLDST